MKNLLRYLVAGSIGIVPWLSFGLPHQGTQLPPREKTTSAGDSIPVIFHIVLPETKLNQIGGIPGVQQRIASQLEVLNRDYNGRNADSMHIPEAFKSSRGSANLYFGLAHTDPKGRYTPGYTITTATAEETYAYYGGAGSGDACSDVKFKSGGGVEAWATDKYLNIWICDIEHPVTNNKMKAAVTMPEYVSHPQNEWGLVLNYGAFGRRSKATDFYLPGCDSGRTAVHELGHFFTLLHLWGLSPACSSDDGFKDTPPQTAATVETCPSFPLKDACSPDSPGVMFMNFLDLSAQECLLMFTKEQAAHINASIAKHYPEIVKHPELLRFPTAIEDANKSRSVVIYPNPASGFVFIQHDNSIRIEAATLTDVTGKTVLTQQGDISKIDLKSTASGTYFIRLTGKDFTIINKIFVQ